MSQLYRGATPKSKSLLASALLSLCLNYNTVEIVCQVVFIFFLVVGVGLEPTFPSCTAVVLPIKRPNHLFLYPYCTTFCGGCQEVFSKSLWKTLKVFPTTTHLAGRASPLLYPYCITIWVVCQEVFYSFARVFCEECLISLH